MPKIVPISLPIPPGGTNPYEVPAEQLLPRGPIWRSEGVLGFIRGLAVEWARIHNRLFELMQESHPETTLELLSAWEDTYGLPLCHHLGNTIPERRMQLIAKVAATGGASEAYFIELVELVGGFLPGSVSISVGAAGLGFQINIADTFTPIGSVWEQFVWTVNLPYDPGPETSAILACMLNHYKPAHTQFMLGANWHPPMYVLYHVPTQHPLWGPEPGVSSYTLGWNPIYYPM